MRVVFQFGLSAVLLALATQAGAQFQKPEDAIRYRQSGKFVLGQHFRHVAEMANGKTPFNPALAVEHMAVVQALSTLPWPAFAAGTDKGAPHRAKPQVWTEPARFKELSDQMVEEVGKLRQVAQQGNLDQLKQAFGKTAQTCKACHEANRGDQYVAR